MSYLVIINLMNNYWYSWGTNFHGFCGSTNRQI